ncbi:MAG: hypothetical protein AAGG38_00985 [Planctomycetota bacterium]
MSSVSTPTTLKRPDLAPPPRRTLRSRLRNTGQRYLGIYLLMVPTIVSMAVFSYYPKLDVFIKSTYRWTPGRIEEFIGTKHFLDAFADPLFWQSFRVIMIMLIANLFKMWPAIIAAIALHRIISDRWRYLFQVSFVIPMVIPGIVWLLVWKSFYDPDFGLLNRLLNATGAMSVLHWLDGTDGAPGAMPVIASALRPVIDGGVTPIFGGVWAMILLGGVLLTLMVQRRTDPRRWLGYVVLLVTAWVSPMLGVLALTGSTGMALAGVGLVLLLFGLAKGMGSGWVIWPFLLIFGIWACWGQLWRLPLLIAAGITFAELVYAKAPRLTAPEILRWSGGVLAGGGALLVALGMIWTEPTNQFVEGRPAWLGNQDLVLPSLILWGFPWVSTIGVLIYLAGLQQIGQDVYEAAELDGVGPIGTLFKIELPLIMTQVRINLIFMTIGTLTGFEFFLILLGEDGGPGNVGMVPGLYMYKSAFSDLRYGYACALGMVLFVIILLLTIVYQKYVKVEK